MTIKQRLASPTPPFFKRIRNTGLALAALAGSILAAKDKLPAKLVEIAGYVAVAGAVATTVSQGAVEPARPKQVKKKKKTVQSHATA
ncbi:hypothetical protein BH11BAC4_BH11BAC4_18760 [soil metagenome]